MQVLAELGIDFHDKKVLEVGAGTGRFTQRILPFCKEIVCVDPDDEALLVLRDNISDKRVSVLKGTIETVPLKKEYFDYAVYLWSMHLIDEKEKVLQICYDSLIRGGCVVILQAISGDYEKEKNRLYSKYDMMDVYDTTCEDLIKVLEKVFGRVTCDTLNTFFFF
ncbi:MAG: class I SAM-dependent methyltransferase [Bdellovibrionota bacterium]